METTEKSNGITLTSPETPNEAGDGNVRGGMRDFFRIFTYSSSIDIVSNVIGAIFAIGAGTTLPLMAIVFGDFTTKFTDFGSGRSSPAKFRKDVNSSTLWFVYLFIAKFFLTYGAVTLYSTSALRITSTIRSQFIKATLRQEIGFFDSIGPGGIAVKGTTNANQINSGISEKLARLISSLSMIVAALVVGLVQSWKLTLIVTAVVIPVFILLGVTMTMEANIETRILNVYSQSSNFAEEVLGSIKTVRAFNAGSVLIKKYDQWLVKASTIGQKKSLVLAIMYGADFFFSYVPYAMAFWQGTRMYLAGDLNSVGTLITIVFSVLMIAAAISQIAPSTNSFVQAASAASELFTTLDRESKLDSSADEGERPSSIDGHIDVHNASFSYPARPDIPILKNVSFNIPANKVTAIVGASGSGKSTIIALLERWYEPTSGYLSVDGYRIDNLNVKWLRSQMRLVQQEPVLFNDTIFNNVIQGLTGTEHEFSSIEEKQELVVEACEAANATEFIDQLSEGYLTNVGERAGLLSGGQKQRIAIARSIISNPRILLLDEATSALDAHSEGIVQNALDKVSKSRTTIVIAHKLATIMQADNIIVLDQGEIVEQGTHLDLLQTGGAYDKLVNAQQLGSNKSIDKKEPSVTEEADSIKSTDGTVGEPLRRKLTSVKSYKSSSDDRSELKQRSLVKALSIFLRENLNLWPWYLIVFIGALIGGGLYPAQSIIISRLITAFELERTKIQSEVNLFALIIFIVALISLVTYGFLGWSTNVIAQSLTRRYRFEMLESLIRQDISFFDRPENPAAALTSRLSTMPTGLQELIGINLGLIMIVMVNLTGNTILALVYGWKLALVVFFGGLPLIFGSGYLRIRLEMKFDDKNAASFAESARFASEAVGAMRTVACFTIEESISAAYDARLQISLRNSLKQVVFTMFWYALADSVQFLAMALTFWYGGKLLADGEYTTDQFFIIYTSLIFGGEAAGQFFAWTPNITKAYAGANYILNLRYSEAEISNDADAKEPDSDGGYKFDKAHFSYPLRKNVQVLRGLDLTIKPGTSVAFVGGSGCGKSTTIGLLERYYDPTSGNLCFGDEPLPTLQLNEYRSCISLVSQEPTLYQGSIRENIALGAIGPVSEEQIMNAARDANILDFVNSLPEGLGTDCGSRGMQLSGGQKQRIAIARALVRDPKILLLDEATSALDTHSEKIVQGSLSNASRGRTTISVAHRLSTIRDCDTIFVFENGRIAESGTHEELLELHGRYQRMCEAQSLDRAV